MGYFAVAGVAANMSAILGSHAKKTPRRIDWPVREPITYNLSLLHSLFFSRRVGGSSTLATLQCVRIR